MNRESGPDKFALPDTRPVIGRYGKKQYWARIQLHMPWEFLSAGLEFLVAGLQYVRFAFKRNQSRSWPMTSGTVQPCRVVKKHGLLGLNRSLSVFGYSFRANESRYAGFFALEADSEETAQTLQKQAVGITVVVRYNSQNPDVSLLEDEMILGRKTIQNPHWLP